MGNDRICGDDEFWPLRTKPVCDGTRLDLGQPTGQRIRLLPVPWGLIHRGCQKIVPQAQLQQKLLSSWTGGCQDKLNHVV
jgi:hypothetical protein